MVIASWNKLLVVARPLNLVCMGDRDHSLQPSTPPHSHLPPRSNRDQPVHSPPGLGLIPKGCRKGDGGAAPQVLFRSGK